MIQEKKVRVGDELRLRVDNIGEKGDGIAHVDEFVVIVPEGKEDHVYDIKIIRRFPSFAIAEIIKEVV